MSDSTEPKAKNNTSASSASDAPLSVDTVESSVQHEPESRYSRHNHLGGFKLDCAECNPPKSSESSSTDIERLSREAAEKIVYGHEFMNVPQVVQIIQSVFNGYQLIPVKNQDES